MAYKDICKWCMRFDCKEKGGDKRQCPVDRHEEPSIEEEQVINKKKLEMFEISGISKKIATFTRFGSTSIKTLGFKELSEQTNCKGMKLASNNPDKQKFIGVLEDGQDSIKDGVLYEIILFDGELIMIEKND